MPSMKSMTQWILMKFMMTLMFQKIKMLTQRKNPKGSSIPVNMYPRNEGSHVKHGEKKMKNKMSEEANKFGDVFKKSLEENIAVTPENNVPCKRKRRGVHWD